jgi:seryl-tRNA synthetase
LRVKNFDAKPIVEKVLELDEKRRALQEESDALLAEQKKKAAEIGGLMKQKGNKVEIPEAMRDSW